MEDKFAAAVLPIFSKIEMKPFYWPEALKELEALSESEAKKHYLSDEQREHYALKQTEGIYKDFKGKVLHGAFIYVLLPNDRLYGIELGAKAKFFHSYLSSGSPVKAAGVIYCLYGRIITVSNESGHYKPTFQEMLPALCFFQNHSLTPLIFEDHSQVEENLRLNKNLPNEGVRHFQVEPIDSWVHCNLIEDLETLKALILANAEAAELSGNFGLPRIVCAAPATSSYVDCDGMDEDIKLIENDSFMTQTCLARMRDPRYRSRALGPKNKI